MLPNRNLQFGDKRTSMRFSPAIWDALNEIARREAVSVNKLVQDLVEGHQAGSRTRVVRDYVVRYFREASTEEGHVNAGHGSQMGSAVEHTLRQVEELQSEAA